MTTVLFLDFPISYHLSIVENRGPAWHGSSSSSTIVVTCDLDTVQNLNLVMTVALNNCYSCFQLAVLQQPLPGLVIPAQEEVTLWWSKKVAISPAIRVLYLP